MILLDGPYVSPFLLQTIVRHGLPVVATPAARAITQPCGCWLDQREAVALAHETDHPAVYTNSENALAWIVEHLADTALPEQIDVFKDKARFRELVRSLDPGFVFHRVSLDELETVSLDGMPVPFVIKPASGFFSLGVHTVARREDWPGTIAAIRADTDRISALYPTNVLDPTSLILEEYIEGDEYAVDAYYDTNGDPVVLGILQHRFASAADVGDRVYVTSRTTIEENLEAFTAYLARVGELVGARNFPVHVELRRRGDGTLSPIEFNPLRFGGWCTTADLTWRAWGFNPYVMFLRGERPDWRRLAGDRDDTLHALVVLDNTSGVQGCDVAAFDYDALLKNFSNPLEVRRIDPGTHPLFGFVFLETPAARAAELDWILASDLRDFITLK